MLRVIAVAAVAGGLALAVPAIRPQPARSPAGLPRTTFNVRAAAGSSGGGRGTPAGRSIQTLVLPVYFSDGSRPSLARAAVEEVVFRQVDAYYREQSYGALGFSGLVRDWVRLPLGRTCDTVAVRAAAVAAADPAVDLRAFETVVIVAPYAHPAGGGCGWSGTATLGPLATPTAAGVVPLAFAHVHASAVTPYVVAHELGHTLGNLHAGFLDCGDVPFRPTGCRVSEYGDYYDVLGRGVPTRHFNAAHKARSGWFDDARRLVTPTGTGVFTVTPLADPSPGVKALRIPRADGTALFVEYRQSIGFDAGMDQSGFSDVFQGALLHLDDPDLPGRSLLLDPTPPAEHARAALRVGDSFADPASGVRIRVLDRTPERLLVLVEFPGRPRRQGDLQ